MRFSPSTYVRRNIGEHVYLVHQLRKPNLVRLNEDADRVLRCINAPLTATEVLSRLDDSTLSLHDLESFLINCVRLGVLEPDQQKEKNGREANCSEAASHEAAALLQEYSAEHRIPTGGSIEITTRCNLRCCHCYLGEETSRRDEMNYQQWVDYAGQAISKGCIWMEITGGEPLLSPAFPDLYRFLVSNGVVVTVLTNGTTLTSDLLDLFQSMPPSRIEVSMYGFSREVYESVTRIRGSHARFVSALNGLAGAGVRLELKAIMMRTNCHEFRQMREYANSLGAFFRFSGEIHEELDGSPGPLAVRLSPAEVARIDFSDPERAEEIRSVVAERHGPANRDVYQCRAGINGFHIGATGIMHPCITERGVGFRLSDYSFEEVWDEHFPRRLSLEYAGGERCATCDMRSMCKVCPPRSRIATGNELAPVPFLCDLATERIKLSEGR